MLATVVGVETFHLVGLRIAEEASTLDSRFPCNFRLQIAFYNSLFQFFSLGSMRCLLVPIVVTVLSLRVYSL